MNPELGSNVQQTENVVFDGDWKTRASSASEYEQRLTAADQRYTRLLEVLLLQLQGD